VLGKSEIVDECGKGDGNCVVIARWMSFVLFCVQEPKTLEKPKPAKQI
jgi:hypothetical protein